MLKVSTVDVASRPRTPREEKKKPKMIKKVDGKADTHLPNPLPVPAFENAEEKDYSQTIYPRKR